MLGMVSLYTSTEHTIIEGSGIPEFLARLVVDRLFLLRYNKLGVFCICEWTDNHKDTFTDVLNLGKSLGNFGRKAAQELRRRLFTPLTAEETSREIVRNDSDFYHNLQEEDMEETERVQRVAMGE